MSLIAVRNSHEADDDVDRYTDMLEKNPFIDAQDILSKASEFGLKIWRLDSESIYTLCAEQD